MWVDDIAQQVVTLGREANRIDGTFVSYECCVDGASAERK